MGTPDRHFQTTLLSPNAHRATARAIRPTQSAQRVRFACSKCAPHHSESDSTHPKCAEGSLCTHFASAKCAPRHSKSDWTHPKCANGSLGQKCCSEVSTRSVARIEVLLRSVAQKCRSEGLLSTVAQQRHSEVSLRGVAQICVIMCVCVEVSLESSLRRVAQECC